MTKGNICGRKCPTLYRGFGVGCHPHCPDWLWLDSVGGAVYKQSGRSSHRVVLHVVVTADFLGGRNITEELGLGEQEG